jgi:hypothetical protein
MQGEYHQGTGACPSTDPIGYVATVVYRCAACGKGTRFFTLLFQSKDKTRFVMKVGQYPPWEITPDRSLARLLDEHVDTFKKGLICESQGYGIAAYAYYRRITELIIDNLLDSLEGMLDQKDRDTYRVALAEAKRTRVAQDKIALVKDLLPDSLRPNGMNPLALLHDTLSEGIHEKPDEECLELAGHVRSILAYLVNEVLRSKDAKKNFTESMKRLLDKKSGK